MSDPRNTNVMNNPAFKVHVSAARRQALRNAQKPQLDHLTVQKASNHLTNHWEYMAQMNFKKGQDSRMAASIAEYVRDALNLEEDSPDKDCEDAIDAYLKENAKNVDSLPVLKELQAGIAKLRMRWTLYADEAASFFHHVGILFEPAHIKCWKATLAQLKPLIQKIVAKVPTDEGLQDEVKQWMKTETINDVASLKKALHKLGWTLTSQVSEVNLIGRGPLNEADKLMRACFVRVHVTKTFHLRDQDTFKTKNQGEKRHRGDDEAQSNKRSRGANGGRNQQRGQDQQRGREQQGGRDQQRRGQRNQQRQGGSSSRGGPSNGRANNNNSLTCFWCSQIGHKQHDCPAKKLGKPKTERPTQTYMRRVWAMADQFPRPDVSDTQSRN